MTPTLSQLLSARPKAVVFIQTWDDDTLLSGYDDEDAVTTIRNCCHAEGIGRPLLDSIETLLDLIEAKCVAEAPLSDAEIEGMKWSVEDEIVNTSESYFTARDSFEAGDAMRYHNKDIARCHLEIKRLRNNKEAH